MSNEDISRPEHGHDPITPDAIKRATALAARSTAERATLQALGLSPLGARLFQELRRHDWDSGSSDDGRRVARGRAQAKEVRRLFLVCDPVEAEWLWEALAPDGVDPPRRPSLDPPYRPSRRMLETAMA